MNIRPPPPNYRSGGATEILLIYRVCMKKKLYRLKFKLLQAIVLNWQAWMLQINDPQTSQIATMFNYIFSC